MCNFVFFFQKISYPILCCILEYVYSGEVLVNKESLPELLEAGKALHIKGLDGMVGHNIYYFCQTKICYTQELGFCQMIMVIKILKKFVFNSFYFVYDMNS